MSEKRETAKLLVLEGYAYGILLGWAIGLLFCAHLAQIEISPWYVVAMFGFLFVTALLCAARGSEYLKEKK